MIPGGQGDQVHLDCQWTGLRNAMFTKNAMRVSSIFWQSERGMFWHSDIAIGSSKHVLTALAFERMKHPSSSVILHPSSSSAAAASSSSPTSTIHPKDHLSLSLLGMSPCHLTERPSTRRLFRASAASQSQFSLVRPTKTPKACWEKKLDGKQASKGKSRP